MNCKKQKNKHSYTEKEINYETNSFFKIVFNFFFIPLLNNLPKRFQKIVKKTHKSAQEVIDYKTSHKALEILYNKGELPEKTNYLENFFQKIWFNTNNSKAVRNRLKAVKNEINNYGQKIINSKKDLNILSIASGSARAIIESIANLYIPEDRKVFVSFIDKNPEAIKFSKQKVKEISFNKNFSFDWNINTASNFTKYLKRGKPNIIEMVGLLDYFNDKKTLDLFKIIYNNLRTGGVFITANIDNNKEKKFVTNFIGWNMIYRNDKELKNLAISAGFKKENIEIYYEPLKIHVILVAKK